MKAPRRGSLCNKLCEFRSLIGGLSLAFLTIGFVIFMMTTWHVFFLASFLMKGFPRIKNMWFFTQTHRFSTNFGDFNGGFDGWNGCVCVLLPDIWVLFFLGSVGGDHSWIELSCHQTPGLKYPSIGPFPTFSRLMVLEYFRRSAWMTAHFFWVRTWKAKESPIFKAKLCWVLGVKLKLPKKIGHKRRSRHSKYSNYSQYVHIFYTVPWY